MSRLVVAEFLKVFTTKLWWALLIPVVVIAMVIGFAGAAIAGIPDLVEQAGHTRPAVALTIPISMKQTRIFAVVLGLIAGAGEFRHKTITTSYLTAPSRGAVLAAKTVVHGTMGALYGLVTALLCALGAMARSGTASFPSASETLVIAVVGIAGVTLWAVLGVGTGTLLGNQVAAVVTVLIYLLLAEGLISLILHMPQLGLSDIPPYLPGAGSTALLTEHGINAFAGTFGDEAFAADDALTSLVGTTGQLSWWAGGLLFAGYTAAFVAGGWAAARRRDIT